VGRLTDKKVKAKKPGMTNPQTKADIKKDKRMVKGIYICVSTASVANNGQWVNNKISGNWLL